MRLRERDERRERRRNGRKKRKGRKSGGMTQGGKAKQCESKPEIEHVWENANRKKQQKDSGN